MFIIVKTVRLVKYGKIHKEAKEGKRTKSGTRCLMEVQSWYENGR